MEDNSYFCAHCGRIERLHPDVVVHLETCTIGADERLNNALCALVFARDMMICNDAYGGCVAKVIDGVLIYNGAAMLYGEWPLARRFQS